MAGLRFRPPRPQMILAPHKHCMGPSSPNASTFLKLGKSEGTPPPLFTEGCGSPGEHSGSELQQPEVTLGALHRLSRRSPSSNQPQALYPTRKLALRYHEWSFSKPPFPCGLSFSLVCSIEVIACLPGTLYLALGGTK